MKKIIAFLLFMTIFFAAYASAKNKDSIVITSYGEAKVINKNTFKAREAAIKEAMKNAVMEAVSSLVSYVTVTDNIQILSDVIYKKSEAYIESFKILSESTEERLPEGMEESMGTGDPDEIPEEVARDSFYTVTIEFYLTLKNIRNDLISMDILSKEKNLPKFIIFIAEKDIVSGKYKYWWSINEETYVENTTADKEMMKRFMELGFYPADSSKALSSIEERGEDFGVDIPDTIAINLVKGTNASIVIIGKALTQVMGASAASDVKSVLANINARVIDVETGIIAFDSISEKVLHIDEKSGADEAVSRASFLLADNLMGKISEEFLEEEKESISLGLDITGLNKKTYLDFFDILNNDVKGITRVTKKSFTSGGIASLELGFKGTPETLKEELSKKDSPDFTIIVTSYTDDSVQVLLRLREADDDKNGGEEKNEP